MEKQAIASGQSLSLSSAKKLIDILFLRPQGGILKNPFANLSVLSKVSIVNLHISFHNHNFLHLLQYSEKIFLNLFIYLFICTLFVVDNH